MDTLTHVALGACLGEVFSGKIIGRRAMLWGIVVIDSFNNYGVGWLEPFSGKRFSFNTIYVADPFFRKILLIKDT